MGASQIVSCATAVPPRRLSQEEVFHLLGYSNPRVLQIFKNSDIEHRHFWADPNTFTPEETPDERYARYAEGAMHLACLAARKALTAGEIKPAEVGAIFVATCTGYVCPDLATRLVGHLGLRSDVQRGALLGHGCAGAMPLLQRASDFAAAHPGEKALGIAVEICSAAYFVDHGSLETVVGNAICADGAAAVIVESAEGDGSKARGAGRFPQVVAFQSHLDPGNLDKVGFTQEEGKLRIILAAEIRDLAGPMIERCLQNLLEPRGLSRENIRHWVLHPGGRKVIDAASKYLGLGEEQIGFSRRVLRDYGNMSSPTALFVLEDVVKSGKPERGDLGVLMALGPGFAAEGALLRW
ncbi:MAG TPA: type III polyketide synthase [Candidatus Acidoferrales bacterium]|nr:type III polyketide synthase [Candidatus Acidoferrales bacterium]